MNNPIGVGTDPKFVYNEATPKRCDQESNPDPMHKERLH